MTTSQRLERGNAQVQMSRLAPFHWAGVDNRSSDAISLAEVVNTSADILNGDGLAAVSVMAVGYKTTESVILFQKLCHKSAWPSIGQVSELQRQR